jgi:hypothetical protein
MKWCPRCERHVSTDPESWRPNPSRSSGLDPWCRECRRAWGRDYSRQRRASGKDRQTGVVNRARVRNRQYVYDHLQARPCADCGEADPIVLEFDHVRGGPKVANVAYLVNRGYGLEALDAEIAKCDVVCANCHRRRTARRAGTHRFLAGQASEPV